MTETVSPSERRLVKRLFSYWRDVCGENDLPSAADVIHEDMEDMWDDCFIIEIDDKTRKFSHIGNRHSEIFGSNLAGHPLSDAPDNTLLGCALGPLDEVLTRKIPVTFGGQFTDSQGKTILYRSILLPLSDDGETINSVLGGANCRVGDD